MLRRFKIQVWAFVAALEESLYPFNDREEIEREREMSRSGYTEINDIEDGTLDLRFSEESTQNWLQGLDDKVSRLQSEMIWAQASIKHLETTIKDG